MSYINLAPIDNGSGWWGDTGSNPNCTIVSISGQSAWQVVMPSSNTAIDFGPVAVSPGYRVIFFANIQTSKGDSGAYARLGIDMVNSAMTEYMQPSFGSCDATETGGDCTPQQVPSGTSTPILKAIDFIVAQQYTGNQGSSNGPNGAPNSNPNWNKTFIPAGFQIWCQVWGPNGANTNLTGFFITPVLYILKPGDPNFNQPTSFFTSGGTPPPSGTPFTFGQTTTDYSQIAYLNANQKAAAVFTCPQSGVVNSITAELLNYATETNAVAALYAVNTNGTPGALIATTQPVNLGSVETLQPVTFSFATPPNVVAGTQYALVVMFDVGGQVYGVSGGTAYINANTYFSGFSNPFGTATIATQTLTIYANCITTPITQTYILNWTVTPPSGNLPFTISFSGYLSRSSSSPDTGTVVNGESIQLQVMSPGGSTWSSVLSITTAAGPSGQGYFVGTLQMAEPGFYPGGWQFRAYYAGNTTKNLFGSSKSKKIRDLSRVNALIL
jgi:hypothetical protein